MPDGHQIYTRKVMNRSGFIVGLPQVGAMDELVEGDIDLWGESSTGLFPVGTKITRGCQTYRYALNHATTGVAGQPVQAAAPVHAEQSDDIVVGAAAAAGTYSITLTSTANLDGSQNDEENNFAGGFALINDEAGEGHCYLIKSNALFATTGDSVFILYDPIKVALTTSSQVGLVRNPYAGVLATKAVCTAPALGCFPFAVTASYYFWLPTAGPAACIAHAAIAVGDLVVAGTTAAKADPAAALETTEAVLGKAFTLAVADGESFLVWLDCDPG